VSGDGDTRAQRVNGRGRLTAGRAVLLCAALGLGAAVLTMTAGSRLANESDAARAEQNRIAVRAAANEFRTLVGDRDNVVSFARVIAQSAGVPDMTFAPEPPGEGREMQPVLGADGRILGFLSWRPDRPMARMMGWLAPLLGIGAFGLVGFVCLCLWQLRRPRPARAASESVVEPSPPATGAADTEQQFIRRELPRALKTRTLDVHYQPIVASAGGAIVGVEALLRWTHRERGAISPAKFVPVAEEIGLMDELGGFVLRRALEDARNWPEVYVSVNLSPRQVRDRRIVEVVRQALNAAGIAPKRLMLEITEGVLIDNPEEMLRRINELRAIGVRIALDDFGSGYSSLGYLQRFAFDKLKIDRSFVTALGRSPNAAVIVQAIVALGRALGVQVVVEGVETEEQRVLLRLAGCDEMQGFLFAHPAPAKAIDALIAARSARSVA
jgi:EAL domain-containing protein (putative c-di-GMP-specific phosphodiesterase class I)